MVYNEKSALQAEHASLLAKMEQTEVELLRLSQIEVERKKATDELDVKRQKTSDERAKGTSMSDYQAMVEDHLRDHGVAGSLKEIAELRATICKLQEDEVAHLDALQASHMEVSGATAQCKALADEVRLAEDRIRKVQETRDNEANALSQTIEKLEEQARKSAQELVEAHAKHAALSKAMAKLQGAGAQAAEELEEHKIRAACKASAQDDKMRIREAELEKALLDVGVELQALKSHTAVAMKDKARETKTLEAKNAELETQLLEKEQLMELLDKDLQRIRTLVGRTREEAHNKVEDMEAEVAKMKKALEEERESDRAEAAQTKAERDALYFKAQQESAAEVTEMEERVKSLKQELTEAKDERAAALSALTSEFTLEKAEMEKAQNLIVEKQVQKMEQTFNLLKETETERDWLASSNKAAMAEHLAAHKEEKDEWKATRESYQVSHTLRQ